MSLGTIPELDVEPMAAAIASCLNRSLVTAMFINLGRSGTFDGSFSTIEGSVFPVKAAAGVDDFDNHHVEVFQDTSVLLDSQNGRRFSRLYILVLD